MHRAAGAHHDQRRAPRRLLRDPRGRRRDGRRRRAQVHRLDPDRTSDGPALATGSARPASADAEHREEDRGRPGQPRAAAVHVGGHGPVGAAGRAHGLAGRRRTSTSSTRTSASSSRCSRSSSSPASCGRSRSPAARRAATRSPSRAPSASPCCSSCRSSSRSSPRRSPCVSTGSCTAASGTGCRSTSRSTRSPSPARARRVRAGRPGAVHRRRQRPARPARPRSSPARPSCCSTTAWSRVAVASHLRVPVWKVLAEDVTWQLMTSAPLLGPRPARRPGGAVDARRRSCCCSSPSWPCTAAATPR